jgi:hypothetical protein
MILLIPLLVRPLQLLLRRIRSRRAAAALSN